MECHILFVGGSGAKCAQTFLEAALLGGCNPALSKVHLHIVDTDSNTPTQDRVHALASQYDRVRNLLGTAAHGTEIVRPGATLSPFAQADAEVTLPEYLDCPGGTAGRNLLQLMLPEDQMGMNLKHGLYGRPGMGAAIWRRWADQCQELPGQQAIKQSLQGQHQVRIILVGSVFGGTGASGIPTLAKLYREHGDFKNHPNLEVHALVLTPYFNPKPEREDQRIKGEDHPARARDVLGSMGASEIFGSVHYLGLPKPITMDKYAEDRQDNPTTLIERLAAWLLWTRLCGPEELPRENRVLNVHNPEHVRLEELTGAGGPEWSRAVYRHAAVMAFLAFEYGHAWGKEQARYDELKATCEAHRNALAAWLESTPHQPPFEQVAPLQELASTWLNPAAEPAAVWNSLLAPLNPGAASRALWFKKAHPNQTFHADLRSAYEALHKALA